MNPILQKLGFSPNDRVVIVHADDFGMCQATLPAVAELFDAGLVSSAAVMVPCPWFASVAAYSRNNPTADVGVHTTLTCEWDAYRWGPLSTHDAASGLIDNEGYLPRTTPAIYEQADPQAVARELRTQLERALAAGIDVTHIDPHMGAVFSPRFLGDYINLGLEYKLPAMLPRMTAEIAQQRGMSTEEAASFMDWQKQQEAQGFPLIDQIVMMPLDKHEHKVEIAKQIFDSLMPGLSYYILHPSVDTPELRAIAPDWRARVGDYEAFLSPELRNYVQSIGVHVIGYRAVRDAMRK